MYHSLNMNSCEQKIVAILDHQINTGPFVLKTLKQSINFQCLIIVYTRASVSKMILLVSS